MFFQQLVPVETQIRNSYYETKFIFFPTVQQALHYCNRLLDLYVKYGNLFACYDASITMHLVYLLSPPPTFGMHPLHAPLINPAPLFAWVAEADVLAVPAHKSVYVIF